MDWSLIVTFFIGGGLGGAVAAYVALRKLQPETQKMNVDAAAVASKALIDLINAMTAERGVFTKRIDEMEAEQETHRIARNAEIDELKTKIQADLMDTRQLRIENLEKEKRINRLEEMAIKQSEYIDTMKAAMQNAKIPVPLNGELLESARRLKLSREERERLKAGK